jgi:hypothetical protein
MRDERPRTNAIRRRGAKPIWEVAEEIAAAIPKSELRLLPADAGRRLDAYLYTARKRRAL